MFHAFALSGDGKTTFLGGRYPTDTCGLRIIDSRTRIVLHPDKKIEPIKPPVQAMDTFPKSRWDAPCEAFIALVPNRTTLVWGGDRLIFREEPVGSNRDTVLFDKILSYALTPDRETLVTRPGTRTLQPHDTPLLHLHDWESRRMWGVVEGPTFQQPQLLAISPDSRTLATLRADGGIWLSEVATRQPRLRLDRAGLEEIHRFTFSADGAHFLSQDTLAQTGLMWDLFEGLNREKLTEPEMNGLWDDLEGRDAAKAFQAIGRFASDRETAVPYLKKWAGQLQPLIDPDRLAARPFDKDVVLARRVVEALERCGTSEVAEALAGLATRLPYANPAAAAERLRPKQK